MGHYTFTELFEKAPAKVSKSTLLYYLKRYGCTSYKGENGKKGKPRNIYVIHSLKEFWFFVKKSMMKKSMLDDYMTFAERKGIVFNISEMVWNNRKVKIWKDRLVFVESNVDVMRDWYAENGVIHNYKDGVEARFI